jgi:Protein of unknown function (DUF2516)
MNLPVTEYDVPQGLLIGIAIALVLVALVAVIDAALRPASAFERAGQKKTTWLIILIATGLLCGPFGTVAALYYFFGLRPKLKAAA